MPINRKSQFRPNILASSPLKLFEMTMLDSEANIAYLNVKSGNFTQFNDSLSLLSQATDGIFSFEKNNALNKITYKGTSFARFSFLIAVLENSLWRLRFRILITPIHGMLIHPSTSTLLKTNGRYEMPEAFRNNTNTIIGIQPKSNAFVVNCQIMANSNGWFGETFKGLEGSFAWNNCGERESTRVDQLFDHKKAVKLSFNRRLYRTENPPLSTFQEQRTGNIVMSLP